MSNEESELRNEGLDISSVDETDSEHFPSNAEIDYSPTSAQQRSLGGVPETNSKQRRNLDDRSDSESVRSRFSDSSSDDGQPLNTQKRRVQHVSPVSLPVASSQIANESNAEPSLASITWEQLCKVDFGPMDDPNADMNLTAALRIQDEKNRGLYFDQRPRSPFRAFGPKGDEDLYLQSIRSYLGQNLSNFDNRHEPLRYHANGLPSPLRKMRSVDDLSPESPVEQEWDVLIKQAGLGQFPEVDKIQAIPNAEDDNEKFPEASAPATYDGDDSAEVMQDLADPGYVPELVPETPPQLHISTDCTNDQTVGEKQPPQEAGTFPEEAMQDDPPTPPSAEELQMMTKILPDTSLGMLQEAYEHLKASSFEDPAETLTFKRRLIDYERRGQKFNGLDDRILRDVEQSQDPSIAKMYMVTAAHIYRRQRDEVRDHAHEQYEKRAEAERMREEDGYEISMLKHELEVREEKLEKERRALAQKTREAELWQQAYEKFEPIAKREFDGNERREKGEDERRDVQTQTERYEVESSATRTIRLGSSTSKQLIDECDKLTKDNENLKLTVEKLETEFGIFRDRNQMLEERIAGSNEAWQAIADADVDVSQGKNYIIGLQHEVKSLNDENARLKTLLENLKKWHEEQEEARKATVNALPTTPQPAATPLSLPDPTIVPFPISPKNPRWREREERIRNTESWKRNRDAILRQFAIEAEERKRANERKWEEELKAMGARRGVQV